MTFTYLSDDYADDCWTLSDAAVRLHGDGLVWSNRKLLDCRIPVDDLPRFSRRSDAIGELLDAKWWRREGDVFVIRHHAQYQATREAVLKRQETSRLNGAKGGRPARPGREQAAELAAEETQLLTQPGSQPGSTETQLLTQQLTQRDKDKDKEAVRESSSETALALVHEWPTNEHVPRCLDCGWGIDTTAHGINCEEVAS